MIICCMTHRCIGIFLFMTGSSAWLSSASGSSSNVPTIISAQSSGTESNQSISALDTPKIGQHYHYFCKWIVYITIWSCPLSLHTGQWDNNSILYWSLYNDVYLCHHVHYEIDRTSHLSSHLIIISLVFAAEMRPSRIPSEHLTGWKYALQSLDLFDLHVSILSWNKIYLGTPMLCIWG